MLARVGERYSTEDNTHPMAKTKLKCEWPDLTRRTTVVVNGV